MDAVNEDNAFEIPEVMRAGSGHLAQALSNTAATIHDTERAGLPVRIREIVAVAFLISLARRRPRALPGGLPLAGIGLGWTTIFRLTRVAGPA